jgi:hypothetical protein
VRGRIEHSAAHFEARIALRDSLGSRSDIDVVELLGRELPVSPRGAEWSQRFLIAATPLGVRLEIGLELRVVIRHAPAIDVDRTAVVVVFLVCHRGTCTAEVISVLRRRRRALTRLVAITLIDRGARSLVLIFNGREHAHELAAQCAPILLRSPALERNLERARYAISVEDLDLDHGLVQR